MAFASTEQYQFQSGDFFLGLDGRDREVGIRSPRHALTIAGSRSGKGACVIIPNLKRWPHNVLCIDPKGENARETWEDRTALGNNVYVIDPFEVADVPAHLRASFNPLSGIDPDSLTASADIEVIADGLVKRSDPRHAQWDDGAVSLIAGIIAYVIAEAPDNHSTLKTVRDVLLQDREDLYADAQRMKACEAFDGIAQEAGDIIMTSIESEKAIEQDFVSSAKRNIKWLNRRAMQNVLNESTFDLAELKSGKASVYLVLPPELLDNEGNFLRLFVRSALNVMAKGGSGRGEKCLFFLDEFFSLGKIDMISKSAGLMPSFGVHLWPILQDLGQLISLYGNDEAQTFFGNADLHQFFGNTDQPTLEYVSTRLGVHDMSAVPLPPSAPMNFTTGIGQGVSALSGGAKRGLTKASGMAVGGMIAMAENASMASEQADYQTRMNAYQHQMQKFGKPRYPADEVAKLVERQSDDVADNIIAFVFGNNPLLIKPAPFFRKIKTEHERAMEGVRKERFSDAEFEELLKTKAEFAKEYPAISNIPDDEFATRWLAYTEANAEYTRNHLLISLAFFGAGYGVVEFTGQGQNSLFMILGLAMMLFGIFKGFMIWKERNLSREDYFNFMKEIADEDWSD